jgi:DNA invertase Pin-like site-specific DNA recombinase
MMSTKISSEHVARKAIVYVRQSSAAQVRENLESQRRQYKLVEHARSLGFGDVELIDQDLGQSGSTLAGRTGFQRLVAQVSLGAVGAVLCLEASRLARNNRDWHHLIDLCGLVGALLIDPEGVYDPRLSNDRLLLGLKGTMSEFELTLFRQRSHEARHQKAARGELRFLVPVGFQWSEKGALEKKPDLRIQQAHDMVFAKFRELGSARQTLIWLREHQILLPKRRGRRLDSEVVWALPCYATVLDMLNNPIYAGAYSFGRTDSRTSIVDERAHVTRGHHKPRSEWTVLIQDHHPGYITWEEYERNQKILTENANMKGRMARGAPREGGALLAGLCRCGRCGRKLHVHYSGKQGVALYRCRGASNRYGDPSCLGFRGTSLERAVEEEVLKVLEPGAIEAAVAAGRAAVEKRDERLKAVELELEQARYEAERSFRQYDASDPENRLVTGELERRWNESLLRVRLLEERLRELAQTPAAQPAIDPRELLTLGSDFARVWQAPTTDMRLKKRIVRTLVEEIVTDVNEACDIIEAVIHWKGGIHSTHRVRKNPKGHRRVSAEKTVEVFAQMAGRFSDEDIALTLNRVGIRTARGLTWNAGRVRAYRCYHHLPALKRNDDKPSEVLTLNEAANILGVCAMTVRRLIGRGILPAVQAARWLPWSIRRSDLDQPTVQHAVQASKSYPSLTAPRDTKTPKIPGL